MNFLQVSALWGLLAFSVPVLIHFLSTSKRTKIPFGTISFLQTVNTTSSRSLQLSQIPLLISRILFISAICFLMAKPYQNKPNGGREYWVEDQIINSKEYQSIVSQLPNNQEINIFSLVSDSTENSVFFRSAWQMISHLNKSPDSISVYSLSELKTFKGSPVPLSSKINWMAIPQDEHTIQTEKGYEVISTNQSTRFILDDENNYTGQLIFFQGDSSSQIKEVIDYLREFLPYSINWTDDIDQADWIIESSENIIENHTKPTVIFSPTNESISIERCGLSKYIIRGQITIENMMNSNLPVFLASLFNQNYVETARYDHRQIQPLQFSNLFESDILKDNNTGRHELSPLWYLILIPILFLERTLSLKSKGKSI